MARTHFIYTDFGIFGLHINTSWIEYLDLYYEICRKLTDTCTNHLRNTSEPKWSAIIEASTSSSIDITLLWHLSCKSLDHLHCFGSKQMLRVICMLIVSIVIYLLPFIFFTQIWNISVDMFLFYFHLLIIEKIKNKYVLEVHAEYKRKSFQV